MKTLVYLAIFLVAIFALYYGYLFLTAPSYRSVVEGTIDPTQEPLQEMADDADPIPITFPDGEAILKPVATYIASVKIGGTKKYSSPWSSDVAKYDLLMLWGRLAAENLKGKIKFKQDMRWTQFMVKNGSGFEVGYVSSHSSNTHAIPANKNILKTISRLSKGTIVEMKGYLVALEGTYKGGKIWWNSSLKRDDTGAGACEVFYIESIRIGSRLYE